MADKLTSLKGFGEGDPDGFDGKKRWGNSAQKGHGVNSPAMMEARKNFKSDALKKKTQAGTKAHLTSLQKKHGYNKEGTERYKKWFGMK